jgi:hypothetical protein
LEKGVLALNNKKKIPLSNPNKVKLFFGIPLSSTLTPFLLALYAARRVVTANLTCPAFDDKSCPRFDVIADHGT